MMGKFKDWLKERFVAKEPAAPEFHRDRADPGAVFRPDAEKPRVQKPSATPGQVGSTDQDKNDLIRNRYVREDTGTHETLKILDDSIVDSGEETGIDPYNTGGFDRSKNWNNRFRK